ncbi:MAG: hypothetical protein WD826_06790 [Actinomycetota bacterium]
MNRSRAAVLVLLAAMSSLVPSGGHHARAQEAPSDVTVLLDRVAGADDVTYRARQLVVYFGEPQSAAVLDVTSGDDGRFVRAESGSAVSRVWSSSDVDVVDGNAANLEEVAPPKMRVDPDAVSAKYALEIGEPEDHLGTELVPLTFERRADGALVERWWVHEASGVLYRRAFYDDDGMLLGLTTILEMDWTPQEDGDPVEGIDATTRVQPTSTSHAPTTLSSGYALWQTYSLDVDGAPTEQWVYSDGLHALSVFRSPGGLDVPAGFTRDGRVWKGPGPGTWTWEGGGYRWVAVAEETRLDPTVLLDAFPHGGPTVGARLGSVWSRLFRVFG